MKQESQRIEELIAYLKKAKVNQLTIDMGDLMQRFSLTLKQVRDCMNKVF